MPTCSLRFHQRPVGYGGVAHQASCLLEVGTRGDLHGSGHLFGSRAQVRERDVRTIVRFVARERDEEDTLVEVKRANWPGDCRGRTRSRRAFEFRWRIRSGLPP